MTNELKQCYLRIMELKTLTIKIPKELHKLYRARLLEDDRTASADLLQHLIDYVESPKNEGLNK